MSTTIDATELTHRPPAPWLGGIGGRLRRLASSSLLRKSGLSILDQAIVSGTSFVTAVLLGRCVLREELGHYYLALSVVFFARGIQEQLVSAPYMIYCHRKSAAELPYYAGSVLLHQCAIMLATALSLAAAVVCGLVPAGTEPALTLLLTAAPLLLIREFVRQYSFAHLELKSAIALDLAAAAFQIVCLLVLAVAGRLSATSTLAVMAGASAIPVTVWFYAKHRPMLTSWTRSVRDFGDNWIFARWALASQLLACTTPYVMPWIVALTHGPAETGTLGACATLVGLSNTFLMGLSNYLSPQAARAFAEGGVSELRRVLQHTALLFLASLGVLAIGAFLVGEYVAVFTLGTQFHGTGPILGVLSLSVLANSLGVTAGNGLWAMEQPRANFVADICSLFVVIFVTVLVVPSWGPLGAATAMLAGTSSDAAVRLWILRQTMRERTEVATA